MHLVDNGSDYNGDGTSGLHVWGAQIEAGDFPSEKWFTVFGSGPANGTGLAARDYGEKSTTQTGKIFAVQLTNGGFGSTYNMFDTGDANSVMGDPSSIDGNFDFQTDVVYIGATISQTHGKMYRLNMAGGFSCVCFLAVYNWGVAAIYTYNPEIVYSCNVLCLWNF